MKLFKRHCPTEKRRFSQICETRHPSGMTGRKKKLLKSFLLLLNAVALQKVAQINGDMIWTQMMTLYNSTNSTLTFDIQRRDLLTTFIALARPFGLKNASDEASMQQLIYGNENFPGEINRNILELTLHFYP